MKRPVATLFLACLLSCSALATDFYVDAIFGDDYTGLGTAAAPWKTITTGLAFTQSGDTLHVNPGIYDLLNGEIFPMNVPDGVALIGAGAHMSVVDGTGVSWPGQTGMVELAGSGEVSRFLFRNGPTANWWDAAVVGWYEGDVFIRDNIFAGPNLNRALILYDLYATPASTGTATVTSNIAYNVGPADGFLVFDYPTVTVAHNTAAGSVRAGFAISQINVTVTGLFANNIAYQNGWVGLEGTAPQLRLVKNDFFQNVGGGLSGTFGTISGTLNVDPLFVSVPDHDFHLGTTSTLINVALNLSVFTDVDGEPRGFGGKSDVGADEVIQPGTYLRAPVQQGQISAIVTVGQPGATYFQVIGIVPAAIPTGYGILYMDPNYMLILAVGTLPPSGAAASLIGVSSAPAFVGLPIITQSLVGYTLSGPTFFTLL
ncbi:MAG: DUF1565 domain-containing protein [Planctomycetes bacterium]|nr:DUF1565 domain-containing protein [Planctomycetota bacterium]